MSEKEAFNVNLTQLKRDAGVYPLADYEADDGTKFKRV